MSDVRDDRTAKTPPYVPFPTFKTFIADLAANDIPGRIDRSVLQRFSGSTGTQLMTSLRALGLILQDGKPTDTLAVLVSSYSTSDWAPQLHNVIAPIYAPILSINLEKATPSQFSEAFGSVFPGTDAVQQKCIAFFLAAAQE